MSDTILDVQNLVGGYGKMTILNGTTFRCRRDRSPP
jgi:branched-chain amino acid transport system ATP-binding protein